MFGPAYSDYWLLVSACALLFGVAVTLIAANFIRTDTTESER